MTTAKCEFGLWELTALPNGVLTVTFSAPSDRRLRVEWGARLLLKLVYTLLAAYLCFSDWSGLSSFLSFGVLMLLLPLASAVRRGPGGDNRFIPYSVVIDRSKNVITLTDTRGGQRASRTIDTSELHAAYLDVSGSGMYAAPRRIVIQLKSGERIRLPPHGLDSSILLENIYPYLPQSVARDASAT